MLILIWFTFMFSNLKTFEIDDDRVKTNKIQKMIEHIERIRSLIRKLEEDDTTESGDEKSSESELSDESGTDTETETSDQSAESSPSSSDQSTPSSSDQSSPSSSDQSTPSSSDQSSPSSSDQSSPSSSDQSSPSSSDQSSGSSPSESSPSESSPSSSDQSSGSSPSESSPSSSDQSSGSTPSESSPSSSDQSSGSSPSESSPSESSHNETELNSDTSSSSEQPSESSSASSSSSEQPSESSSASSSSSEQPSESSSSSSSSSQQPSESSSASSSSSQQDPLADPTIPTDITYPDPPRVRPIYLKPTINRNAFIHILRYRYFRIEEKDNKFVIKFVLLLRFINISPLANTTFSVKVNIDNGQRELQESQQESVDATVLCNKHSQFSFDSYAIDAYYICSTEVSQKIKNVESYNDFDFKDSAGQKINYSASLQAIKASKNLNEETQPLREFVYFENAAFSKGTDPKKNSTVIRGNLKGDKKDEVAKEDKIILTFYENKEDSANAENSTINALNSTCNVLSKKADNFEVECFPESFHLNGSQQFLVNGTTIETDSNSKNIEIYLNTTEESDSFLYYAEPQVKETNREAKVHFLGYNKYKTKPNPKPPNPLRPVLVEFTFFVRYVEYKPFRTITFTLQLTYYSVAYMLRRLQVNETQENTTAVCELDSVDDSTGTASYNCAAEATAVPNQAESLNNFEFIKENGEPEILELGDINFSNDAVEGGKNLTTQVATYSDIVSFNDVILYLNENDTSSFFVKGILAGKQRDKVAKQDSLIITFFDTISENEKYGYNTSCEVVNHDPDDFLIKCFPEHNVTGDQYLANGTTLDGDVGIYLNNTQFNSTFEFTKYGKKTKNSNVVWRKTSSGLSGGAIAGIVIACAVTLILITILLMFLRRAKRETNNNSTIVGLKSVDYYNE